VNVLRQIFVFTDKWHFIWFFLYCSIFGTVGINGF